MFQIFIDEEEVVCESDFQIKEEFMNLSSVELYKVFPKSWKGTNKLLTDYYYPQDYTRCKIYKDNELYFTGIVKNSADMDLNPFKPHYCSLQILDPSTLLSEGETLEYVIVNKTVEQAINMVIDSITDYGFVTGKIVIPEEANTIIGAYSTLDKAPYDIFQYLSQISGTRWGTRMIDEDTTAIDFYDPVQFEKQGTIETTQKYFKDNKIRDLKYDYSTNDYRNKQVIKSDSVFANINTKETLIADGYSNTFTTEQKIGQIISIKVHGIEATFATKDARSNGVNADFYYEISGDKLEAENIYSSNTPIVIEYVAIIKGREVFYNYPEISRVNQNLGRKGVISRYESRNDVTDNKELSAIGKSYIKYKGIAEISLNITSDKDFLIIGGKYQFNAPKEELTGEYLVKAKTTNVFQNNGILQVTYDYVLTNSFDTENELNYFDNQRAKANGNIAQGEFISRNIDVENTTLIIFDNLQIESIVADNVLDCILDVPFIK